MRKIPTIFLRDTSGKRPVLTPEWDPECLWVRDGEGEATRKWDGSACLVRGGAFYKRLKWDAAMGSPPVTWLHHSFDGEVRSGHGWALVTDGPDDWAHRKAWAAVTRKRMDGHVLPDGTYELCGPGVNGNPEGCETHVLIPHGKTIFGSAPRTFEGLREWLSEWNAIEGLVWHHPDGRMAKIKLRDFGIARKKCFP